jgi:hypothetical protein
MCQLKVYQIYSTARQWDVSHLPGNEVYLSAV